MFSQIPILHKSERMFYTVIAFYVAFVFNYAVSLFYISMTASKFDLVDRLKAVITTNLIIFLNICGMQLAFCWIAQKYNQPLMTRKDLRTGQNVSLLIFIRSRFNMRKIFDPDTDP